MTVSVLRKAPPWLDRVLSLVAAGLVLFVAYRWWVQAWELIDPCGTQGLDPTVCKEVAVPLQGLQFAIAIVGIVVAVVLAALALFQAVSGRRVQWIRAVAIVFAVIAVGWGAVFVLGRLTI